MKKVIFILTIFAFAFLSLNAEPLDPNKSVTVYVHGFNNGGYKRKATYGEDKYEDFFNSIPSFIALPTTNRQEDKNKPNVVGSTDYYGDKPPAYYSAEDIEDIEDVTAKYGGGIPRYAMIVAKYAKHLLKRTGAKRVNFVSGSMGALVTRWLIEKNYENLASDKKIGRWLTLEGVVGGNYAASNNFFMKIWKEVDEPSIDVEHMSYEWINNNLHNPHRNSNCKYFKDILIGHETSTKDDALSHALTTLLFLNGQYMSNDGFQVVYDTYFNRLSDDAKFMGYMPTHSYFHINHLGVKTAKGAWVQIAAFLLSNKRVQITLQKAGVYELHEKNHWYAKFLPAEVVFESEFFSSYTKKRWQIEDAISQRLLGGAVVPVYKYHQTGEKTVNQTLFDDFVFPSEKELKLKLSATEIDGDERYGIFESFKNRKYENIDTIYANVPLKDGVYTFKGEKIDITLKVKIINYPFKLLGEEGVNGVEEGDLEKVIKRLYGIVLEREPGKGELNYWIGYLKEHPDKIYTLSRTFLLSKEIKDKDLSVDEFIALSYETVFGYSANLEQIRSWREAFERGITDRSRFVNDLLRNDDSRRLIDRIIGKEGGVSENAILERGKLVHFEKVMSKNSEYLKNYFKDMLSSHPELTVDKIRGVEAYKIIYTTANANGEKINASGLLTLPKDVNEPLDLVSDQHGTKFGNFDVPSTHDPLGSVGTLVTATKGYAVAMPDYIGYGKSLKYFHPYLIKKPIANSIIDMIFAVKEFLDQRGIKQSGKLFLSGYSEGGYATMAALEEIEKDYKDKLQVTAGAPMAGSYDMKTTADMVLNQEEYEYPNLPAFVLYSYDYYYNWKRLHEIFKDPYANELDHFFKEKAKGNMLHIDLPAQREKMYQDKFIEDYLSGGEKELRDALDENSIIDWKPTMKMRLYHCEGDKVVPVINSQNAYKSFVDKGSKSVELITKEGGGHAECSIPFYIDAYEWFDTLR